MIKQAKWIANSRPLEHICPVFHKDFNCEKPIKQCTMYITAMGVYRAELNGLPVSRHILAPGWTVFEKRLQYQTYDITSLVKKSNRLEVLVGQGWYRGRLPGPVEKNKNKYKDPAGLLCEIEIIYTDGTVCNIRTDESWQYSESAVRFSDIYDGETYNSDFSEYEFCPVALLENVDKGNLIPQEGPMVSEQEIIYPLNSFVTPKGEWVIDFGQEITGYIEVSFNGKKGETLKVSHGEVLDKEGNFYNENYRSAKAEITYICKEGYQTYKPLLTFFGFRYIRVDKSPDGLTADNFKAIVVHSDMERTGYIETSNPKVNKLFQNIIWGQKGNFVDIPTDCPQRDERLGWTCDAQVFARTASYNFDVEKFFEKWLGDLAADQSEQGEIPSFSPNVLFHKKGYKEWCSASAWGDAACICPWQMYLTYGNVKILEKQFNSMKGWVDFLTSQVNDRKLLDGLGRYGDWVALDAQPGAYKGATRIDLITLAFYHYSTEILIKSGRILLKDIDKYEQLLYSVKDRFKKEFKDYKTQTECVLAIYFGLCDNISDTGNLLNDMIAENGYRLKTGFVGTPYLLHALSMSGHTDTAYKLLLQEEFPSWLYSVNQGATTVWEHWDSRDENGDFWSPDMNSFNHYAYGSVADWIYGVAAGIETVEAYPGFARVRIAPQPNNKLEWLKAVIKTRNGEVSSKWQYTADGIRYEITTPCSAEIVIEGKAYKVEKGQYVFYSS